MRKRLASLHTGPVCAFRGILPVCMTNSPMTGSQDFPVATPTMLLYFA